MKLLTKTLFALLFITMPAIAVDNATVEMYPDERAKLKLAWNENENFLKLLEKEGWSECYPFLYLEENIANRNFVYIKMNNKKELCGSFFITYQYRESGEPDLNEVSFNLRDIVFQKNKWDVPRPLSCRRWQEDKAITLSWRYIDYVLHEYPTVQTNANYLQTPPLVEELFSKIKENRLENTFMRLLLLQHGGNWKAYRTYDTKQELTKKSLLELIRK